MGAVVLTKINSLQLREMGCLTLILGVTGNALKEDVDFFISKGADDVLSKPLRMGDLKEVWKHFPVVRGPATVTTNLSTALEKHRRRKARTRSMLRKHSSECLSSFSHPSSSNSCSIRSS
jgi:CheY-like chemotaxis protein